MKNMTKTLTTFNKENIKKPKSIIIIGIVIIVGGYVPATIIILNIDKIKPTRESFIIYYLLSFALTHLTPKKPR